MTDERTAVIALNMVPGVGSVKVNRLIGNFKSAGAVFSAPYEALCEVEGIDKTIAGYITNFSKYYSVEKELLQAEKKKIKIITILDDAYPPLLKKIYDPPPVLYCYGAFDKIPENSLSIGIVGTRQATDYGERALKKILKEMKESGIKFTIVSGMARGIDTIAHIESVRLGMFTVAVMGFGLNQVYPFENHYAAKEIIKAGLLVSEFPLEALGSKQTFPRRNRIISGLSDGVLVVEAGRKSGALITSDCALEQGRQVFAIPGNIFSEKSEGTNWLISQGAKAVSKAADITEEFEIFIKSDKKIETQGVLKIFNLNPEEEKIYGLLTAEKKHIDNLAFESNISVIKLSAVLTMLELKGAVKQVSGMCFVKN